VYRGRITAQSGSIPSELRVKYALYKTENGAAPVWTQEKTNGIDNSLVCIFHDLEQARRCCNRAVMMKDGRIVFDGDINEAMRKDMLMEVYDYDVNSYISAGNPGRGQL
jgi:hypothetical protein